MVQLQNLGVPVLFGESGGGGLGQAGKEGDPEAGVGGKQHRDAAGGLLQSGGEGGVGRAGHPGEIGGSRLHGGGEMDRGGGGAREIQDDTGAGEGLFRLVADNGARCPLGASGALGTLGALRRRRSLPVRLQGGADALQPRTPGKRACQLRIRGGEDGLNQEPPHPPVGPGQGDGEPPASPALPGTAPHGAPPPLPPAPPPPPPAEAADAAGATRGPSGPPPRMWMW